MPSGLVIPHIINGAVNRLRVRRDKPGDGARYICISGSSPSPMTMNLDGAATIIVESELDALLLSQEAGDLVGVVALGSAQAKPDKKTHEILKRASLILVALDADEAGAKASWSFWPATYGAKSETLVMHPRKRSIRSLDQWAEHSFLGHDWIAPKRMSRK